MKTLKGIIPLILMALSTNGFAQGSWSVLEVGTGVMAVQGELQDQNVGFNGLNSMTTLSLHTRGARSQRVSYGGSVSFYTTNMSYADDKQWLNGHWTLGQGINAQLSVRLLLTGRDDMRFMKNAFITYLELGAGAHFISNRSTYPPSDDLAKLGAITSSNEAEFAPSGSATIGFQYFISQNWGVQARLNGQYVSSDRLDGIVGSTNSNDYLLSTTLGMIYAF